ncbi:MAG: hypothetical protein RXR31_08010 [Thermoproteota archaeon]
MAHYEEILSKVSPMFYKIIQYANYFEGKDQILTYWSYLTEVYHFPKNIPYEVFSMREEVIRNLALPLKTGDYHCNVTLVEIQDNKIIDDFAENNQESKQYWNILFAPLQKGGLWSVRLTPKSAEIYIIDTILNNFFNYCWEDQEKIVKYIIAMIGIDLYETIKSIIK